MHAAPSMYELQSSPLKWQVLQQRQIQSWAVDEINPVLVEVVPAQKPTISVWIAYQESLELASTATKVILLAPVQPTTDLPLQHQLHNHWSLALMPTAYTLRWASSIWICSSDSLSWLRLTGYERSSSHSPNIWAPPAQWPGIQY